MTIKPIMSEAESREPADDAAISIGSNQIVKTLQSPKKAKKRAAEGASSNVFSMFEQAQIQEFKEASISHSV